MSLRSVSLSWHFFSGGVGDDGEHPVDLPDGVGVQRFDPAAGDGGLRV